MNGQAFSQPLSPSTREGNEFSTVDWHHENLVSQRYRELGYGRFGGGQSEVTRNGFRQFCWGVLHLAEPWILVAIVGILTAASAAYIEIGTEFLSDMRIGRCDGLSVLNQRYCCGSELAMDYLKNTCISSPFEPSDSPVAFRQMRWHSWSSMISLDSEAFSSKLINFLIYVGISVAFASMAALMVREFSPLASGSGIPEVKTILGGFVMKGVLNFSTLFVKCIGLCLSVSSGLAIGKEGPLVHVACCWANLISKISLSYRNNEGKRRELVSAAAAAGVSVAFGAPIGGVLFSLEEVSSYFPPKTLWYSFFAAVIAALSYKSINPSRTDLLTMFQLDSLTLLGSWETIELIPFAFLGLMGGIFGAVFIHLNVRWNAFRRRHNTFRNNAVMEVIIVVGLTAAINFNMPLLKTLTSNMMEALFARCEGSSVADNFGFCAYTTEEIFAYSSYRVTPSIIRSLGYAAIIKFTQAVFTFGIGVPAGLFMPSLAIGSAYGRLMGLLMIGLDGKLKFMKCFKCIHPGIYALVGAASMLGGVTRMTISLVVILLELSGGLTYVVPFMIVILISKWVGDAICEQGIYDGHILLKGYPFLHDSLSEAVDFSIQGKDIMERRLVVIPLNGNTVGSLSHKLAWYKFSGFPLVHSSRTKLMLGYIPSHDLEMSLQRCAEIEGVVVGTPVYFKRRYPEAEEAKAFKDEASKEALREATFSTNNPPPPFFNPFSVKKKVVSMQVQGASIYVHLVEDRESRSASWIDFEELVVPNPIELIPETPLSQIWSVFRLLGLRICFFTRHGVLQGLLTKKALLSHLHMRMES